MTGVAVFAGDFASQPLVFAHLLDAAEAQGLVLDLDHVEVIQGAADARLAHVFAASDCVDVLAARQAEETLVLVFSEALIPGAVLFAATPRLRPLGRFAATRARIRAP